MERKVVIFLAGRDYGLKKLKKYVEFSLSFSAPSINNKLVNLIRKIHYKVNIPFKSIWLKTQTSDLDINKNDILIFFDSYIYLKSYKYIDEKYKDNYKVLWFWNSIDYDFNFINKLKDIFDMVYTFDKKDSNKYKVDFHEQILTFNLNRRPSYSLGEYKYNVLFVGLDKGRKNKINIIEENLNNLGLSTFFYVVESKRELKNLFLKFKKRIPYQKNIELLKKSQTILDIPKINQTGLTLRILEALYFNKKIITTNSELKNYDFYHPNNILVLDDSLKVDISFFDSPYMPVDNNILEKYTAERWIRTLVGDSN